MKEKSEIMREYVTDMLGVEQHILQSIERQLGDDRVADLSNVHTLLQKTARILNSHIAALEQYLSSIDGGYEQPLKKAATTIAGTMAGLYARFREDPVSKNLRDDYTALNLAAISYEMLYTTALGLHDDMVAEMCYRHLTELTPLVVEISKNIPFVVTRELSEEGKIFDATVGPLAVAKFERAWSHEYVNL